MRSSVDVHNYLLEREAQHELFNVRGRLRSAERIAAVLDLPPEQVGKVVVFDTDRGPAAALVASNPTADPERVRPAVRAKEAAAAAPVPPPRVGRSAGGVVSREPGGGVEAVLAARRSRSGDLAWGLAKGWVESGEDPLATAVREVREETGLVAEPEDDLGEIS